MLKYLCFVYVYTIFLFRLLVWSSPPLCTLSQNTHLPGLSTDHTWCHTLQPIIFETSTIRLLTLPTGNNSNAGFSGRLLSRGARDLSAYLGMAVDRDARAVIITFSLLESSKSQRSTVLIVLLLSCPVIFCLANMAANTTTTATTGNNQKINSKIINETWGGLKQYQTRWR